MGVRSPRTLEHYSQTDNTFPKIFAVHFVVYGVLGRGVSGSSRLDAFAKGMGDWLRDVVADIPVKFIEGRQKLARGGRYAADESNGSNAHKL